MVEATSGGVGAIFVDDEGEAIDQYTTGDEWDIKLTGAHHSVLLAAMKGALKRMGNNNSIEGFSIKSEKFTYSVAPVEESYFLVLVQDTQGLPSEGLRALQDAVPRIVKLI